MADPPKLVPFQSGGLTAVPDQVDPLTPLKTALADRYRIEREIGQGGMATVYLAEDLRHHRQVAIKVLRPELAAVLGAERFVQEITTTAQLQHPHILPLFDSGSASGFLYYVMPYVAGESLRNKLDRETQLAIAEAVQITTEVADALDYAHRHGVIHRDIKPENILLHDGRPMVADFGIALAVSAAAGGRMTESGISLGTPHYMSPEQATADKDITGRSDIYSLASVLYEMLAGQPPHLGGSAQQIIMKVVTDVPRPVTELRKLVPPNVAAALAQALEKLPADRFATASDFAHALSDRTFRHGVTEAAPGGPAARPWKLVAVGALGGAGVLVVALAWLLLRPVASVPVSRYGLAFATGQAPVDRLLPSMALAPDGSSIIYVGPGSPKGQLWVKRRDQFEATALPGTDGAEMPSVSPDGNWVLYFVPAAGASWQLRKIPIGGGASVVLADSAFGGGTTMGAWLADGTIVYVDTKLRLRRLPAGGGAADSVWASPTARVPFFLRALPSSRGVLFTLCGPYCRTTEIWALDFRSGKAHPVGVSGAVLADYTSIGQIVYVQRDGSVLAVPFSLDSLATTGPSVPLLRGVQTVNGMPAFALSRSGTLLMLQGPAFSGLLQLVWVTRTGAVTPVDSSWFLTPGGNRDWGWSLSPDGKRLATGIHTSVGNNIWIKDLPHGPLSRFTLDSATDVMPYWSPDGHSVTFVSNRAVHDTMRFRVWAKRADGSGGPLLSYAYSRDVAEGFRSPDGKWLVLTVEGPHMRRRGILSFRGREILVVQPGEDSAAAIITAAGHMATDPLVSPNSHWISYVSNENGQDNVFVRPFPNVNDAEWQISTDGGDAPLWAHSGRELFYLDGHGNMVDVRVRTTPSFSPGARRVLFHLGDEFVTGCCVDITPDDQRFLMARWAGSGQNADRRIILVENWLAEVKKAVEK